MSVAFDRSPQARQALEYHCPRWRELPALELYMDQMTGYIADVLRPLLDSEEEERPLTKAMVNNYVKARMIPRPDKKKYRREHLAHLILLCAMKQVLSLPEAWSVLQMAQQENTFPQVYDYFCQELENALSQVWNQPRREESACLEGEGAALLRRLTQACANKIYLQKRIAFEEAGIPPEARKK